MWNGGRWKDPANSLCSSDADEESQSRTVLWLLRSGVWSERPLDLERPAWSSTIRPLTCGVEVLRRMQSYEQSRDQHAVNCAGGVGLYSALSLRCHEMTVTSRRSTTTAQYSVTTTTLRKRSLTRHGLYRVCVVVQSANVIVVTGGSHSTRPLETVRISAVRETPAAMSVLA